MPAHPSYFARWFECQAGQAFKLGVVPKISRQVEYPTYQGDFIVKVTRRHENDAKPRMTSLTSCRNTASKVHSVFGYQKEYYFNQWRGCTMSGTASTPAKATVF